METKKYFVLLENLDKYGWSLFSEKEQSDLRFYIDELMPVAKMIKQTI